MPLEFALIRSPAGNEVLRTVSIGYLDAADAATYMKNIGTGGPYFQMPVVAHMPKGVGISSEARKLFTSTADNGAEKTPFAIIVGNGAARVLVNFLLKVAGSGDWVRVFTDEGEALGYLDEALAKQKTPAG